MKFVLEKAFEHSFHTLNLCIELMKNYSLTTTFHLHLGTDVCKKVQRDLCVQIIGATMLALSQPQLSGLRLSIVDWLNVRIDG